MKRRTLVSGSLACSVLAGVSRPSLARGRPNVVVLGGGAGGASAARTIASLAGERIDVTLVDAATTYRSCFYSNVFLGGFRDLASITFGYDRLVSDYAIRKVTERAVAIERDRRRVVLSSGAELPYDRLVLSPGISLVFESVPGYAPAASENAPHAWTGGEQTALLARRIAALEDGDDVVIVAPPNPYRCPPGPYERASLVAHVMKERGFARSKVTIIDAKPKFSKQALFTAAWTRHYPGRVQWIGPDVHGGVEGVEPRTGRVETALGGFGGALLNVIPAQRAGKIATEAGLGDATGWCPIEAGSMRSTRDRDIFVIGDASKAGAMPKSAFAANSQAKVAAANVLADLLDRDRPEAAYANTCWSLLARENSVKVGAFYEPRNGKIVATSTFVSAPSETPEERRRNWLDSRAWYDGITADMFG